jgi:hypothetical protein
LVNQYFDPTKKKRNSLFCFLKRFPFDDQLCFLKFGSWTYDATQVILTNRSETVDMLNYVDNGK